MILHSSINRGSLVKLSTLFFRHNVLSLETHQRAHTGSKTMRKRFSETLDQNSNRTTYVIIFYKQKSLFVQIFHNSVYETYRPKIPKILRTGKVYEHALYRSDCRTPSNYCNFGGLGDQINNTQLLSYKSVKTTGVFSLRTRFASGSA